MTLRQELSSWAFPTPLSTSPVPSIGSRAPSSSKLPIPACNGKATIVTFLRHCGCPFAEKTFLSLRTTASAHPEISCVAVSHSDQAATDKWLESVGGAGDVQIVVDPDREVYAQWGLGISNFWHVLSPWSMWSVYKLGKEEGIWNRPTESGSRWQTSGSFAIDEDEVVTWGEASPSADWIPDFGEALETLEREKKH
ncbi:hypothetical protein P7C71_g3038, partial [Lecanoromycetidae sp. Uapishka_2]